MSLFKLPSYFEVKFYNIELYCRLPINNYMVLDFFTIFLIYKNNSF